MSRHNDNGQLAQSSGREPVASRSLAGARSNLAEPKFNDRQAAFFQARAANVAQPPERMENNTGQLEDITEAQLTDGEQHSLATPVTAPPTAAPRLYRHELTRRREKPASEMVLELQMENHSIRAEVQQLRAQNQQLHTELVESQDRVTTLERWIFKLQQQLQTEHQRRQQYQAQLDELSQRVIKSNEQRHRQIHELVEVIEQLERELTNSPPSAAGPDHRPPGPPITASETILPASESEPNKP